MGSNELENKKRDSITSDESTTKKRSRTEENVPSTATTKFEIAKDGSHIGTPAIPPSVISIGDKSVQQWDELIQESVLPSLRNGKVIAVPTDTIYGVACLAQSTEAIAEIYNIKHRDLHKPIAICVSEINDISQYAEVPISHDLLKQLLPGPVTLVLKRKPKLNPKLNPTTDLVGVRIPDNGFIRHLAQACESPLALTSANISADPSCTKVQEFEHIWNHLAVVVDGGDLISNSKAGSTVVDVSVCGEYKIIRPGQAMKDTVQLLEQHGLKPTTPPS